MLGGPGSRQGARQVLCSVHHPGKASPRSPEQRRRAVGLGVAHYSGLEGALGANQTGWAPAMA